MKNKIWFIMLIGLIVGVIIAISPINAINEDGYIVEIDGVEFKIPNSFSPDSEPTLDEDGNDIYGNSVHLYAIYYLGENEDISIGTTTRYSEPFTQEDALDAGGNVETINGKTGKLKKEADTMYVFSYVENGVKVMLQSEDLELIKYCTNTTN